MRFHFPLFIKLETCRTKEKGKNVWRKKAKAVNTPYIFYILLKDLYCLQIQHPTSHSFSALCEWERGDSSTTPVRVSSTRTHEWRSDLHLLRTITPCTSLEKGMHVSFWNLAYPVFQKESKTPCKRLTHTMPTRFSVVTGSQPRNESRHSCCLGPLCDADELSTR